VNKRDFVFGACAAVAASAGHAGVAPAHELLRPGGARCLGRLPDLVTNTRYEAWCHYVGESFDSPGREAPIVLHSLDLHHPGAGAGTGTEQFTLVFESVAGPAVESAILPLRHRTTGQRVAVFLQNAGSGADGATRYRAEFNILA
jgi:hypothetical protein